MSSGHHFDLGVGYVQSELSDTDTEDVFNYGGRQYKIGYNYLFKVSGSLHQYAGLNFKYYSLTNNSDNSINTESAVHMSPGINYKLYYNNIFLKLGYNYSMADHQGSGDRSTEREFEIHEGNIAIGYDYPITKSLYLMGAYSYGVGISTGLEQDLDYNVHTISLNFLIHFGNSNLSSAKNSSNDSRSKDYGRGRNNKRVDKRNGLYDFFIITD